MNEESRHSLLRTLPSVDSLLNRPEVARMIEDYPRMRVLSAVREALDGYRAQLLSGEQATISLDQLIEDISALVRARSCRTLTPIINATGVILNTGLGRAVMAQEVSEAVAEAAGRHVPLEIDLESGERGSRQAHVRELLKNLTGAEDALVVNNNAAAVFLAINALADGKEVIISRGELVEIGGSFRIPDIILRAGARLIEVGTTNKTRLSDFEAAISSETGLLLSVHPSNFRIVGFTESVPIADLVGLGKEREIPTLYDLGSGALEDFESKGLPGEPHPHAMVEAGVDIVTFSGDKLLGGPQAGIAVGSSEWVRQMTKSPIARVVRVDKMSLTALEATLRLYEEGRSWESVPTLRAIAREPGDLKRRAEAILRQLRKRAGPKAGIGTTSSFSEIGGGSFPDAKLSTWVIWVAPKEMSVIDLAQKLRLSRPGIVGRVSGGRFLLDLRTVLDEEDPALIEGVSRALEK